MKCVTFSFPVKYERIKFLVLALKNAVEVYAWAPKPYHKFMAFKVSATLEFTWVQSLCCNLCDLTNLALMVGPSLLVTWCTNLCWST